MSIYLLDSKTPCTAQFNKIIRVINFAVHGWDTGLLLRPVKVKVKVG